MRVQLVRYATRDPENLAGPQVDGSLVLIEGDVTGDGIDGDHLLRCMFGNPLAGAQIQKGQTVSGLIDKDFGGEFLLVEFDELLKIVFPHFGGRSNDQWYRRYLTASDPRQTVT